VHYMLTMSYSPRWVSKSHFHLSRLLLLFHPFEFRQVAINCYVLTNCDTKTGVPLLFFSEVMHKFI